MSDEGLRLLDELTTSVSKHEAILQRLFTGHDVESLLKRSREELVYLALSLSATDTSPMAQTSPSNATETKRSKDGADSLEALEQAPDQDSDQDETKRQLDTSVQRISDDVNGLSLSVDRHSSYVGVSSITAALKVIFKVAPGARYLLARTQTLRTVSPSRCTTPSIAMTDYSPDHVPSAEEGSYLIEAYFEHIHALIPMIDESQFWHDWLYANRRDSPWLALLNTVFALGSMASSDAYSEKHTVYFHRAMKHIDVETLGSTNILVVQALGLLSGYYLHYVNRPNLANNLLGATLRMATVMGLHREFQQPFHPPGPSSSQPNSNLATLSEIRRRDWWCLFCLDTWASTTTGRPSFGRSGPGITLQPPQVPNTDVCTSNEKPWMMLTEL